jgi:hypothetical protein
MRGSRSGGYKYPERHLGQRGADRASKRAGPTGLGRPAWAHFDPVRCLLRPVLVPESSRSSPFCMWALVVSFSPSWTKLLVSQDSTFFWLGPRSLSSSRVGSLALGVMFTSLLDLYRASRSCHEVLNELIPEVLLSTLKPCINTKLQNQHAQVNLLYLGG